MNRLTSRYQVGNTRRSQFGGVLGAVRDMRPQASHEFQTRRPFQVALRRVSAESMPLSAMS